MVSVCTGLLGEEGCVTFTSTLAKLVDIYLNHQVGRGLSLRKTSRDRRIIQSHLWAITASTIDITTLAS